MKRKFLSFWCSVLFVWAANAQVGIGTNTPHAKAALEIKSTDKGVLFPRMTTEQRDDIENPPDGLHIYNTDEHCLNYFDASYGVWNCYCENNPCNIAVININADADSIDFYNSYAKNYPATKKFVAVINAGVTIRGGIRTLFGIFFGYVSRPALDFSNMPDGSSVKIINYGNIYGHGGVGGAGATGDGVAYGICFDITRPASNGTIGGSAIETKPGVIISIDNYALIAGGPGGGGGGGRNVVGEYGGGGGGGASFGFGGQGGGYVSQSCGFIGCGPCLHFAVAQHGTNGQLTTGGAGGAGANNGGNGGNGGGLGQAGQNGTGTDAGLGGPLGKAIAGGSGNAIVNINGGQSIGAVD